MINQIDSFLNIISDPRNISPEDFSEYFPKEGNFGITQKSVLEGVKTKEGKFRKREKLDKKVVEEKFSKLQKFNITESWNGYIPLMPKIYALLVMFEKQSNYDKEIFLNYFALTSKDLFLKPQSFINEKELTKPERFELLMVYEIFVSHLIKSIGNELTELKEVESATEKPSGKNNNNVGRTKAIIKDAVCYINKNWTDENKKIFIDKLSENYKECSKKEFKYLLAVLIYEGYLINATNKEYKLAFEKSIGNEAQNKSGVNDFLNKLKLKETLSTEKKCLDYTSKKDEIEKIVFKNCIK